MPAQSPVEFYLAGDFIKERLEESQQYLDARAGRPNALPIEAGIGPSAEVLRRTAATFLVWTPLIMLIRATGIDKPAY
jgi:hypothetical protein